MTAVKRKKKETLSWGSVDVLYYSLLRQASNLMQAHAWERLQNQVVIIRVGETLHWMETRLIGVDAY